MLRRFDGVVLLSLVFGRSSLTQVSTFLQSLTPYPGLSTETPTPQPSSHWLHAKIWPRWPSEPLVPNFSNPVPQIFIQDAMEFHLPEIHPAGFSERFFLDFKNAPFGRCKVLKPPLGLDGFKVTPMRYRIPPRPIGYDTDVMGWDDVEERAEREEREMKVVEFRGSKEKL